MGMEYSNSELPCFSVYEPDNRHAKLQSTRKMVSKSIRECSHGTFIDHGKCAALSSPSQRNMETSKNEAIEEKGAPRVPWPASTAFAFSVKQS
jgi:hypothetical protein